MYYSSDFANRPKTATLRDSEDQAESEEKFQLKSFLNITADSGVVETYLLTKAEMQYLPDHELKIIFDYIAQQREPDRPASQEQLKDQFSKMMDWEKEKI